jgi:toxin ParE1/3/4
VSRLGYRLTAIAEEDVEQILKESARVFGPAQRDAYASLLEKAIGMIAEFPDRPGSMDRQELAAGLRSFHLELAARRRGAASHVIFYLRGRLDDESEGIIVIRVLHDAMLPALHLVRGLDQ